MKPHFLPLIVFGLFGAALIGVVVYPRFDLIVSGWFYKPNQGFFLAYQPVFEFLHWVAVKGAWALGWLFGAGCLISLVWEKILRRGNFVGLSSKSWLFLWLALLIGPVLIANGVLKDHWGRIRPHEVTEFGGDHPFSPALMPQPHAKRNGSFVAGDASFGFMLTCFAFVVPRRNLSRRLFWGGIVLGAGLGVTRIAMGSHFFSDVLFAAVFMLASNTALYAAMFSTKSARASWHVWIGSDETPD